MAACLSTRAAPSVVSERTLPLALVVAIPLALRSSHGRTKLPATILIIRSRLILPRLFGKLRARLDVPSSPAMESLLLLLGKPATTFANIPLQETSSANLLRTFRPKSINFKVIQLIPVVITFRMVPPIKHGLVVDPLFNTASFSTQFGDRKKTHCNE